MADETKPTPMTSTQFAKKEDRTVEFGGNADHERRNQEDDQKISVRALRTFHENANMHGKMVAPGEQFECPRGRAAELRANGLIEYVSDGDAKKAHGEGDAKRIDERVKREQEMAKIPEHHKSTPLRNPKLELAEADPKDDPRENKSDKSSKR